ncbi:fatty acid biosynthesis transcriptional regulator [Gottschalkia acidurici 9a]|uniref:Fatty acid biosynthesis transcriptional regulator n=1 Tax=Gottschalkia acidurici (strain ATCC 7906 / DSM 604 / BCRC 14475 / CIP 104303 / KCTC 5404 / NCIMB 10678 / 9a) TaxID=1128398 RepID=K0B126_GOTA9|nr:transcription factor FapR [Gottschalkia acidurici]AFS78645.1 fatty acid biosynthesis transcriptional regulator [Gottschalkia acidurici 9a]
MANKRLNKKERQKKLIDKLKNDPFLTDEELMNMFNVSIQTIRLDRLELRIPELRERIKNVAEGNYSKVRTIGETEIVGELVDIILGKSGISILETNESMTFKKTNFIRGQNIFAQAESLALAVIDADVVLTGVANIKYKSPVMPGEKLIAKAEVVRERGNKYFVHVFTYVGEKQVFRGKFILVSTD